MFDPIADLSTLDSYTLAIAGGGGGGGLAGNLSGGERAAATARDKTPTPEVARLATGPADRPMEKPALGVTSRVRVDAAAIPMETLATSRPDPEKVRVSAHRTSSGEEAVVASVAEARRDTVVAEEAAPARCSP
jgi:hypothetical protein